MAIGHAEEFSGLVAGHKPFAGPEVNAGARGFRGDLWPIDPIIDFNPKIEGALRRFEPQQIVALCAEPLDGGVAFGFIDFVRAREMRLITVPMGICSASAISLYDMPSMSARMTGIRKLMGKSFSAL